MKATKLLSATALVLGFAATVQAQSSVTLYGILDGGIRYQTVSVQNQNSASNFGAAYGVQSGNRFGLRGVEDIGGGNRITFTLENGFDLGNGSIGQSGRLFGRQSWLGIENNAWGLARIGRQYNLATDYFGAVDPFSQGFGQANIGAAFGAANTLRMSNAIKYQSPTMAGFKVGAAYSFANGMSNTAIDNRTAVVGSSNYNFESNNNVRQLSLGANYANGPVYAALSYDKIYAPSTAISQSNPSSWNLGGAYDLKVVKLSAAYGQTRGGYILGQGNGATGAGANLNGNPANANGEVIFDQNMGYNSYLLGATVPVNTASRVMLSWTLLTPNTNMKDVYNAQNQSAYSLGYTYDLSKRTNLYSYVSYMDNLATIDTAKSTVVGVGMRHQF
jgi:general bacterial porin, GBP family